jgi:hypothetical protein
MRSTVSIAVGFVASLGAVGCQAIDEVTELPGDAAQGLVEADPAANVATVPIEQVGACVEQIKFGAYTGDVTWNQIWSDVGETEAGATLYCSQVGSDDPARLLAIHDGWLQTEAFLAAASQPEVVAPAPAPTPVPAATEPPPEIDPSGPDLNCPDIGRRVWVGSNDYHDLDANGDGWGCDSYG